MRVSFLCECSVLNFSQTQQETVAFEVVVAVVVFEMNSVFITPKLSKTTFSAFKSLVTITM